jgi:1-acyl-sn-glycerol-3-phosphate acyltransferase
MVHMLLHDPAVVLKKELLNIPVYGWYTRKTQMIAVDRTGGAKALKDMVAAAQRAAGQGRPIFIFPEGTRTAPGTEADYQPGVAALYKRLDLPVVPVALNSGLFWPRRSFLRKPGTIVVEFLPPIAAGMDRKAFMNVLRERIETATRRLENATKA